MAGHGHCMRYVIVDSSTAPPPPPAAGVTPGRMMAGKGSGCAVGGLLPQPYADCCYDVDESSGSRVHSDSRVHVFSQ